MSVMNKVYIFVLYYVAFSSFPYLINILLLRALMTDKSLIPGVLGGGPPTSSSHCNPMHPSQQVMSFSPKTCLELLQSGALSKQQIDFEFNYFKTNIECFEVSGRTRTLNEVVKTKSLTDCFVKGMSVDIDKYVQNLNRYSDLTSLFSCRLNDAMSWLDEIRKLSETSSTTPAPSSSLSGVNLPEPVSFLDFDVKGAQVKDFRELNFKTVGSRKVCYFGDKPYQYSKQVHEPQDYPPTGALRDIVNKLSDNITDFDIKKFSCLVTLYEDGRDFIPFHADLEASIQPGSNIYTVSIGSVRELHFCNIVGPLCPKSYALPDGSVHCMTSESQIFWEHSIPQSSATAPRISLTFRHMSADPPVSRRSVPPPINSPTAGFVKSPSPAPARRVLFLTDSIHASFNTKILGNNIYCVKKINMTLRNTSSYEDEFGYSDIVVISCGVNDLSRSRYSASALASEMRDQVHSWCRKYPTKVFIFNSILNISRDVEWSNLINDNIYDFNRFMFEMSLNIDNLWFLDTQCAIYERRLQGINPHGNGIHITYSTARTLGSVLQGCILNFCGAGSRERGYEEVWPLRPSFRRLGDQRY